MKTTNKLSRMDGREARLIQGKPMGHLEDIGVAGCGYYYGLRTVVWTGRDVLCRPPVVEQALIKCAGDPFWINVKFRAFRSTDHITGEL